MVLRSVYVALLWATLISPAAAAEERDGHASSAWSVEVTSFAYFLPDEPDYLQPTVAAGRGSLHLEGRYAYEDRATFSLFAGWHAETGKGLKLEVTPMVGLVAGRTDGVAPAVELTLSWGPVELYTESEYVWAFGGARSSFFYAWSEPGIRPAGWLRVGLAIQRTRRYHSPREVSFGPMLGATMGKVEANLYVFDHARAPDG